MSIFSYNLIFEKEPFFTAYHTHTFFPPGVWIFLWILLLLTLFRWSVWWWRLQVPDSQQPSLSAFGMRALSKGLSKGPLRAVGKELLDSRFLDYRTLLDYMNTQSPKAQLSFFLFVVWLIYCFISETKILKMLSKKAVCLVALSCKCGHLCEKPCKEECPDFVSNDWWRPMRKRSGRWKGRR